MPELPEVETTRRGIQPHLCGEVVREVIVRERRLRQPVSVSLAEIEGDSVVSVERRSKYLILALEKSGHLLIHLGMSGSLRLGEPAEDFRKHDHIALTLGSGKQLRYHDPRRFGIWLHLPAGTAPLTHPLLAGLGPEPLGRKFTASHLHAALQARKGPIKVALMDAKVVVGVGNIYASESLFRAGIHPETPANQLNMDTLEKLVRCVRKVLSDSIRQGGTTLRDFLRSDGQPGYFRQRLNVYERKDQPCRTCAEPIQHKVLGQRSTYWCPACQPR